jgi:small conductance mechanosensitive channel
MDLLGVGIVGLEIGLTLAGTALGALLLSNLIARLMAQSAPVAIIGARRLSGVVVWVIGGSFALQLAGVSPEILLLVIALFGIAALVALRAPLENFGAKVFSDVYVPYKVGDTVSIDGRSGKVLEINAMATVLLAPDDRLVSVPNRRFLHEPMENTSPQAWKELTIPVTLATSIDVAAFESALLKGLNKLRARLDPRFPPLLATRARGPQGADLVLTVMIRRPEDREAMLSESTKRVADALALVQSTGRRAVRE